MLRPLAFHMYRPAGTATIPTMASRGMMRLVPVVIALLFVGYRYFAAETFTNAETGESHRVGLSREQESALGLQGYREVLSSSPVVSSGPELELVQRIVARLAPATREQGFAWEASVVREDQANAFCLPGGKMVVYTGIISIARDEAGLATVMGHEMAHATCRHGARRVFEQQNVQALMMGAAFSLSDLDYRKRAVVMGLLGAGAQYGLVLPFSRDHETEADEVGLMYLARAGYDPRAAVGFWQRMDEASSGRSQPPEFASTHPSHGTRIAHLERLMPKAVAEYEKVSRPR